MRFSRLALNNISDCALESLRVQSLVENLNFFFYLIFLLLLFIYFLNSIIIQLFLVSNKLKLDSMS